MNENSNREKNAHSCRLKSFAIDNKCGPVEDPIISFGLLDLEGVTIHHDDVLVIQTTIANYNIVRVFVDSRNSVNILFKEAFDWMQVD